jgi:predicted transcriptional regulator
MLKYHDIDSMLPTQTFFINFSYTAKQPLSFIDSMILRLLNLGSCSIDKLAEFLNINQLEATSALNNLISKREVKQNAQDLFEITSKAKAYFKDVQSIPQMDSLIDSSAKLSYDMIGLNLVSNTDRLAQNGVTLNADWKMASSSEKMVQESFQKNFNSLVSNKMLNINAAQPRLYKIDNVTNQREVFHRIPVNLMLDLDQNGTSRQEFEASFSHLTLHNDALIDTVERTLTGSKMSNLSQLDMTLRSNPLFEYFDFEKFITADGRASTDLFNLDNFQFVGPIYSEENQQKFLNLLNRAKIDNQDAKQDILWMIPTDIFYGKSQNFRSLVNRLIDLKDFNLKMFLPTSSFKNASFETRDIIDRSQLDKGEFFAFNEHEAFDNNIEVICVKDKFCIVVVHISYADPQIFTTIPVGQVSAEHITIQHCYEIFDNLQKFQDEETGPCYGQIKSRKNG